MTPPLLILVIGYPGAGKTFFSRQLAEQYNLPRISEDAIRFELFEKPQFNAQEADIISRVQDITLQEVLKTERTVIVEGTNLRTSERNHIYSLAQSNGYRTITVWLQTDLQTSAFRAKKRDRRNPDSKYAFAIDMPTFEKFRSSLQRPSDKENFVVISGKHAYQSQSLTLLKKITTMYSEQLTKNIATPRTVGTRNNKLVQ